VYLWDVTLFSLVGKTQVFQRNLLPSSSGKKSEPSLDRQYTTKGRTCQAGGHEQDLVVQERVICQ